MNDPYLKKLSKGFQYGLMEFLKDHTEYVLKQQIFKKGLPPLLYNKDHEFSLRFSNKSSRNSDGQLKKYVYYYFEKTPVLRVYENGTYNFNEQLIRVENKVNDLIESDIEKISKRTESEIFSKKSSQDSSVKFESE